MKFKPGYVILFLLFLGLGLMALIGGCVILTKNLDLKFNGVHSKGIIIGAGDDNQISGRTHLNGKNIKNDSFFAELRYLVNNDSMTSVTHSSVNKLSVAIGDEVNVVYRESEPEYVELPGMLKENIIVGCVCLAMGLVFTWLVSLIGYRSVKLKRKEWEEQQNKF